MNALLLAGLVAGILDIVNAIVFWRVYAGTPAATILQSVAAVYGLAARRWRWMLERPLVAGTGYALLTWAAMNHVVVPLSRAAAPPFILPWFIDGLLAHLLLVGLPFAFVARRIQARRP